MAGRRNRRKKHAKPDTYTQVLRLIRQRCNELEQELKQAEAEMDEGNAPNPQPTGCI